MLTTDKFKMSYVYSGLFSSDKEWLHPERTEVTWELIYVVSGTVYIEEDGHRYELFPNDGIILKPNTQHIGYRKSAPHVSFYWVHFTVDDFSKIGIRSHIIKNYTKAFNFKNLLHVANHPGYPDGAAEAVLLTLLNDLAYFTARVSDTDSRVIRSAAEYIRINSGRKLYIDELASIYGMNPQYFSKLFKDNYKIGLKEYICRERMNTAKNLLCNTNYSVKEIAAAMEFSSENEFINYFKYHEKTSPKKFRNMFSRVHMNNK